VWNGAQQMKKAATTATETGLKPTLLTSRILRSVLQLLVTANVVPNPLITFTLMTETIGSSERSDPTRVTWRLGPENDALHSYIHENIKSFPITLVS
jgi:hypothetical protein